MNRDLEDGAIPAAAYAEYASITEVTLSPDGELAAFVAREFDLSADESHRSVFIVPTDGTDDPRRLTRASGAHSPRFSPDGSRLGVLATREEDLELTVSENADEESESDSPADSRNGDDGDDSDSDDAPKTQLWTFDLEYGGDARQVTTLEEGVAEFDWAPDGGRVVVAARDPTDDQRAYLEQREDGGPIETERLQHKYDGSGWLDTVRTYLFVVDCESCERRRLEEAHDGGGLVVHRGGLQPRWSPDGERIAFRSNRTDEPDDTYVTDLYTISPEGGDLERVTDSTLSASSPVWAAGGDRLAFVGSDPDNWYVPAEAYVTDLEEYWSVTSDLDRTIARGGTIRWLDDEELLLPIADEGWTRLVRAAADGSGAERTFDAQGRDRALAGIDHADGTLAAVLDRPSDGIDLFALEIDDIDAAEPALTRLTALNEAELECWETPTCRRLTYESDDGTEIEAMLYAPAAFDPDEPDALPAILSIHGGPMAYDEPRFEFAAAYWTSRGYFVLEPNYRGSTSYGRAFCETLDGAWNGEEVADVLAGVDELVDRGWADPDRLFCTGFSQGGIITGYAVTRSDRFAAAAPEHGVYDMYSAFGTDDCHAWWENDFGLPWENPDTYAGISSIDDVGEIDTPLLLTAGGEDWRCAPSQAEQLYVSVKKRGVPARLVVYPDEHHAIGSPERAIHRLEELAGWFERFDPAVETESEDAA